MIGDLEVVGICAPTNKKVDNLKALKGGGGADKIAKDSYAKQKEITQMHDCCLSRKHHKRYTNRRVCVSNAIAIRYTI